MRLGYKERTARTPSVGNHVRLHFCMRSISNCGILRCKLAVAASPYSAPRRRIHANARSFVQIKLPFIILIQFAGNANLIRKWNRFTGKVEPNGAWCTHARARVQMINKR